MRLAVHSWLIAFVEVATFVWVVAGSLFCVGAILPFQYAGDASVRLVLVSGFVTVFGAACGVALRRRLVLRLRQQSRGFPVLLPPR